MREMSVAQAKEHFSDILARVAYLGEDFLIKRHGKPMAAIVNIKGLSSAARTQAENPWLALRELGLRFPKLTKSLERVYHERRKTKDRWISPF